MSGFVIEWDGFRYRVIQELILSESDVESYGVDPLTSNYTYSPGEARTAYYPKKVGWVGAPETDELMQEWANLASANIDALELGAGVLYCLQNVIERRIHVFPLLEVASLGNMFMDGHIHANLHILQERGVIIG